MDLVYKAQMLTQGGRSGTIQSEDGSVKIKLAVPAAMGGKSDAFEDAYRMALTLTVYMAGPLDQDAADNLLERTKGICAYVDATKTNITLNLAAVLDTPVTA